LSSRSERIAKEIIGELQALASPFLQFGSIDSSMVELLNASIPCLQLFAKTFVSLLDPIILFLSELQTKLHNARKDSNIKDLQIVVMNELARIHKTIIQPV
jgi:hypothetical protein